MEVIFIEPIYKDYIWGGTKLEQEYNKKNNNCNIAESIEVIVNKEETVKVKNGKFKGKTLYELFQDSYLKEKIFGKSCINRKDFPIIIKFIDAKENLSIQVHPSNIINEKKWIMVYSWVFRKFTSYSRIQQKFKKERPYKISRKQKNNKQIKLF